MEVAVADRFAVHRTRPLEAEAVRRQGEGDPEPLADADGGLHLVGVPAGPAGHVHLVDRRGA